MGHIANKISILFTYIMTALGIATNLEIIKSAILFIGALVLIILQCILHWIKIKNARKNREE